MTEGVDPGAGGPDEASAGRGHAADGADGGQAIPDHEFGFELRVCAWAERRWPPHEAPDPGARVLVARQLGTKYRLWDTVVVETTAEGLARRANFGTDALDTDLLHVVRNAPPEWTFYRDALPHPGYPWRYVREAIHRAADRGIVETRRADGNRIEIRRRWTYPDWVDRLVAIENKPDLTASAARALAPQVERDVALGLADEVWIATAATGESVAPILLEDLPVEAGVLTVETGGDPSANVEWYPRTLETDAPGTRILERPDGGPRDQSAARFEYADPAWKAERRLAIAERAYERGWRSYVETMRPDCRHFDLARSGPGYVPRCGALDREQTAAECSGNCPEYEPEPPAWRQRGWPIEGGPGAAVKRVLAERRRRRRETDDAGGD